MAQGFPSIIAVACLSVLTFFSAFAAAVVRVAHALVALAEYAAEARPPLIRHEGPVEFGPDGRGKVRAFLERRLAREPARSSISSVRAFA